jgi:hypothetical protein
MKHLIKKEKGKKSSVVSETLNVDWRQGENHYDGALTGQPASRAFLYIISSIIAAAAAFWLDRCYTAAA